MSFNVCGYLDNCIKSVKKAAAGTDCHIIVIDNNSDDDSVKMISELHPGTTLIQNNVNLGFAAACNQGLQTATGRFVLLLNPDTLLPPGSLGKCISFMNEHTDAGLLGVKLTDENGTFLPESKRALPSVGSAFFKISGINRLFPDSEIFNRYYFPKVKMDQTGKVEAIPGAFMFMRREALLAAGGLDEDYFMYGEDLELSYRIGKAGYGIYYFPQVSVTHFKGKSTPRNSFTDITHFYRAMRTWVRKRNSEKPSPARHIILPAIYMIESLAVVRRFLRNLFHS